MTNQSFDFNNDLLPRMNYNYNMQANTSPNTTTGIKTKHEMDKMEIINKILQQKQEIKILEQLINQSQKNRVKQMLKNKND